MGTGAAISLWCQMLESNHCWCPRPWKQGGPRSSGGIPGKEESWGYTCSQPGHISHKAYPNIGELGGTPQEELEMMGLRAQLSWGCTGCGDTDGEVGLGWCWILWRSF